MPNATIMGMGAVTQLPQIPLRPWGLFTEMVPEIDLTRSGTNRVGFGATIMDKGDIVVGTLLAIDCDSTDDLNNDTIALTQRDQLPFTQTLFMSCTGDIDPETLNEQLDDVARLTRSAALVRALTAGVGTSLDLAGNSDSVGAGADMADAIGLVEDGLADRISNGQGYIFISPRQLAEAVSTNLIIVIGDRLFSPAGHRVISDAGHQDANVYGTGSLAWSITDAKSLIGVLNAWLDIDNNIMSQGWQRTGLVLFNPDHAVRATITA